MDLSAKKKYFFIYLKTGGGHLAPARATFNYLNNHFNDITEPRLIDGFEKTPRWIKYLVEDGYRMVQYSGKWFFEFLYALNKLPLVARITCNLLSPFMNKYLEQTILNEKPDKIVIFHFFCIIPIYRILKRHKLSIPVQTVITDPFTPHPMWFLVKNQNFIVFSKGLKERIIKKGRGYTVQNFPFILDEKFSSSLSQDDVLAAKQKLGYKQDKKVVLILGGGDGIPKGEKILKEILKSKLDAEIGFVCGKNEVLFSGAEKLKLTYNADNLKIYGYVDYIYNLISISNVVITKCGASTIMEILNLKKVPIVNDYIWEQELGNVDYLIENNLGIYEPQIKNLPKAIKQLLEDDSLYTLYVKNISDQKIENGVAKVSSFLINE